MKLDVAMTVRFQAPAARMNMNQRLHWRARARLTREWRHAAHLSAVAQLGAGPAARLRSPCFVRVTFPVDSLNIRRDPSNWTPTCKAVIDGLVDAGVWPDDNEAWVTVLEPRFYKPALSKASFADVVVSLIPRAGALPQ